VETDAPSSDDVIAQLKANPASGGPRLSRLPIGGSACLPLPSPPGLSKDSPEIRRFRALAIATLGMSARMNLDEPLCSPLHINGVINTTNEFYCLSPLSSCRYRDDVFILAHLGNFGR